MFGRYDNSRVRRTLTTAPLMLGLMLCAPRLAPAQVTEPAIGQTGDTAIQVQHPTPPPSGIVEQGAWTVTPLLGFGFGGNLENSPLALGFATAYNWSPRVSFEGELGYARSATQGVISPFDSSVTTGGVNALYHFSAENWAPYATVGLGFGHANTDLSPFDTGIDASNTTLMVNFGGGVKTRLTERVNLRTGMRYYNGNDLVPSFWRPYVGLTFMVGQVR